MPATVRDKKSSGYRAALNTLSRAETTVGIHSSEGSEEHSDGLTVLALGAIHEFGQGVPERSFIRTWYDARRDEMVKALRDQLKVSVLRQEPLERALDRFALLAQADCQKWISDGNVKPPLADSTIRRKGSSKPLIDTGVLRSSILGKVDVMG